MVNFLLNKLRKIKFTTNNLVVVINVGNEICSYLILKMFIVNLV